MAISAPGRSRRTVAIRCASGPPMCSGIARDFVRRGKEAPHQARTATRHRHSPIARDDSTRSPTVSSALITSASRAAMIAGHDEAPIVCERRREVRRELDDRTRDDVGHDDVEAGRRSQSGGPLLAQTPHCGIQLKAIDRGIFARHLHADRIDVHRDCLCWRRVSTTRSRGCPNHIRRRAHAIRPPRCARALPGTCASSRAVPCQMPSQGRA